MEFRALISRALEIRSRYADFEKTSYGREWSSEEIMLGFVGDVGDLAKLVQGKEGVRHFDDLDNALAHELSDCLWALIALASRYEVDLETAFLHTMDGLQSHLDAQASQSEE